MTTGVPRHAKRGDDGMSSLLGASHSSPRASGIEPALHGHRQRRVERREEQAVVDAEDFSLRPAGSSTDVTPITANIRQISILRPNRIRNAGARD